MIYMYGAGYNDYNVYIKQHYLDWCISMQEKYGNDFRLNYEDKDGILYLSGTPYYCPSEISTQPLFSILKKDVKEVLDMTKINFDGINNYDLLEAFYLFEGTIYTTDERVKYAINSINNDRIQMGINDNLIQLGIIVNNENKII